MKAALIAGLTLLSLAGVASAGSDIHVPGDHPTIAAAVDAAEPGDTIRVAAGTYPMGMGVAEIFPTTPNLSIIGEVDENGDPAVFFDGLGTEAIFIGIGALGSEGMTLENLHFTRSMGAALWIYQADPIVRNCVFTETETFSQYDGASVWASSSTATFEACRFEGCTGGPGQAVFLRGVSTLDGNVTFRDCSFTGNSGASVFKITSWNAVIEGCAFLNNDVESVVSSNSLGLNISDTLICDNVGAQIEGVWTDGGGNLLSEDCESVCLTAQFCSSSPNSAGPGAVITAEGVPSIAMNELNISATGGPAGQPGLLFHGGGVTSQPFGEGVRCVSTPIIRISPPIFFSPTGEAEKLLDMNDPSLSGVLASDTRYFQLWYRDPQGGPFGYNLSSGLEITFCP